LGGFVPYVLNVPAGDLAGFHPTNGAATPCQSLHAVRFDVAVEDDPAFAAVRVAVYHLPFGVFADLDALGAT